MRIAILAGVSSDAQAKEDRLSIPDQVKNCRAYIKANSATETAGPYIMDGYSRTGYDSLDLALQEIPPLGQAVKDAADNKYDILLMDNFDRLGDLGFILKTRFKKLSKQLHSVRQSGHLIPPELYDPYANESGDIAMYVEGIIQSYRINKIRRGYNIGVPNRARRGLHPLNIPFGYKLSAKNEPAQIVPREAELFRQLVTYFLAGKTLTELVEYAAASGIAPPKAKHWNINSIRLMLQNPYYAGVTAYGKSKDRNPQPLSKWITAKGLHQPIITEEEFNAIRTEFSTRYTFRFKRNSNRFSGLLICANCGNVMFYHHHTDPKQKDRISCDTRGCFSELKSVMEEKVAKGIAEEIKKASTEYNSAPRIEQIKQKIETARARRVKIQQGFEADLYTAIEASKLITTIEKDIETLTNQITHLENHTQANQNLATLAQNNPADIAEWIKNDSPAIVRHLLTTLCESITITPKTYKIKIKFR